MFFHVVDDHKMNLEVVMEIIEGLGHQVLGFDSADAYIEFCSSEKFSAPAAVITDIRMPGMSGVALVREIRLKFPFHKDRRRFRHSARWSCSQIGAVFRDTQALLDGGADFICSGHGGL